MVAVFVRLPFVRNVHNQVINAIQMKYLSIDARCASRPASRIGQMHHVRGRMLHGTTAKFLSNFLIEFVGFVALNCLWFVVVVVAVDVVAEAPSLCVNSAQLHSPIQIFK